MNDHWLEEEKNRQICTSPRYREVDRQICLSYFRMADLPSLLLSLYFDSDSDSDSYSYSDSDSDSDSDSYSDSPRR